MKHDFDVIVIGGGAAGISAVKTAHGFGKKTAIIEREKLGGECTWNGCVPSKALIHAAEKAFSAGNKPDMGKTALDYVRSVVERVYSEENPESFEKLGVTYIPGTAVFTGSREISVDGKRLTASNFILATGSSPFIPPIEGINSVPYFTNENLFEMENIPSSMIILGGGPIGIEMAQAFNRLGTKVTVVEMLERILFREEAELVQILESKLRLEGVRLLTGTKALKIEKSSEGVSLLVENTTKKKESVSAETVLVAVGRIPALDGLGLENAGVRTSRKGILVDAYLRTSNPHIYACGDAVGPYYFSHTAGYQGVTAGLNVSLPFRRKATDKQVLWTTYTDPELAHAGLTESEAREKYGKSIRVYQIPYSRLDRAKTESREEGLAKYILNKKGRLIGAQILGHLAGELIHEAQLVRVLKIPFSRLQSVMHAYPSYSDIIRQAARDALLDGILNQPLVKLARSLFTKKKELQMKRWIKPLIFLGILVAIFLLVRFTFLGTILTFDNLVHSRETMKTLVSAYYFYSVLIFIAVYFAVTGLTIPGATVLTLAAGFLFGTFPGALIVNVGATLGGSASFLTSRYFLGQVFQERYAAQLTGFNAEIEKNGTGYLLSLRFIPVFPFFLINLLAGMTKIRFLTFLWTTSVGIIPGSLVYAYAGSNLANLKSLSGIFSWQILSVLILLALFSILPAVFKKIFGKKTA